MKVDPQIRWRQVVPWIESKCQKRNDLLRTSGSPCVDNPIEQIYKSSFKPKHRKPSYIDIYV